VFRDFGTFDETLVAGEDTDFFLRLMEAGAEIIHETALANLYRRHPTNMTNHREIMKRSLFETLQRSMARRRRSTENRAIHYAQFFNQTAGNGWFDS
jgi:hypothetical protein